MAFAPLKSGPGPAVHRMVVIAVLTVTLGTGLPMPVGAHDAKLDQAMDSLVLAENLLIAADPNADNTPGQVRKFDRHVERALRLIQLAIEEIMAAGEATDNPLSR